MKTKYYFLAALAATALASCSSDEFMGDNSPDVTQESVSDGIAFGGGTKALTRADLYGSAAAGKLSNTFVVYGTKHIDDAENKTDTYDDVVFNNFQVGWNANTAGTTESNSSDWDYLGLQAYDATPTAQAIKYWDYSAANGYTFYAFSSTDISYPADATNNLVSVTKTTADATTNGTVYTKGYEVTVKDGATLNDLYFSNRVPVAKNDFGNIVNFTFRNLGAKVRVGFYETIPGYDVQITNFYIDEDASASLNTAPVTSFAAMNVAKDDGFYAAMQNVNPGMDQSLRVTYYDATDATIENRPTVACTTTNGYAWSLKLGDDLLNTNLSDNAATPTWDNGGAYTPVFPFETNPNPLLLKLDFTMTANDGSNDVINVKGARAIVPKEFVQWKSNFAYTYIFKISDKTNGTTGDVDANGDPTDPEGLKPITFDGIVIDVDNELQETITSVSTNSITTYAEGAIVNEYKAGEPIYITISDNSSHNVLTPTIGAVEGTGAAAGNAQVYKITAGSASEATLLANLNGLPMGITKSAVTGTEIATVEDEVPLVDGTSPAIKNVKFTPSASGTYAYVYARTPYVATTYTNQSAGTYNSSGVYYMRSGAAEPYVYYVVPVPDADAFNANKANLYTVNVAGTPGVYDVKVIKVQ